MTSVQGDGALQGASLDDLLIELLGRVHGALDEQARLRLLLDAVVTMAADLTLDSVLERIVRIASTLVDARYAALGVLADGPGERLRTFIHHGVGEDVVSSIGELPTGHGLLGLIIDHPEPVRLQDIATHPASSGFPPHHPPMHSFLGVPVRTRDTVFGHLYLTEKSGGVDFTAQDEEIVVALAAAAGVAVENARLYDEARRREQWLAATAEITGQLAGATPPGEALQTIASRAREVAAADVSWIVTGSSPDDLAVEAVSGFPVDVDALRKLPLERSLARQVAVSGAPVSTDDLAGDPRALDVAEALDWPPLGPAVVVPLKSAAGVGALALAWTAEHRAEHDRLDVALPTYFAEHAAVALTVAQAHEGRRRLAVLEDRDRIARDLHDLVIQRLFAVCLGLQSTAKRSGDEQVAERLDSAVDDLDATIKDIRRTIFALGALDQSTDVQTEVERIVARAAATLQFEPTVVLEGPVRALVSDRLAPDLLAALGEALSNAGRHGRATAVRVRLTTDAEDVVLSVDDDGVGMPDRVTESGLANMRERARRHGGSLEVASVAGEGTRLRWRVPIGAGDAEPDLRR